MDIWTPWCHFGGIDIAFTCVIFMISGMYLKDFIEKIRTNKKLLVLVTTIIFVITFYISKANGDDSVGGYIFVYARYGKNYLIYLVNGIVMCLGMVLLAILLEKLKCLSWLGKYSLAIMALYYFVFEITTPIFTDIVKYYAIFATLIDSILTIIVCVPLIMFFNKYLPEAIGKNKV